MDAKEYIRNYNRLCSSTSCSSCPLRNIVNCGGGGLNEESVEIVEKWAKEHITTRRTKLAEIFGKEVAECDDNIILSAEWLDEEYEENTCETEDNNG